jgi:hypothetical protein
MAMTVPPDPAATPDPGPLAGPSAAEGHSAPQTPPSDTTPAEAFVDPFTEEEDGPTVTYPDAPDSLIELWMARRKRMALAPGEALPPLDVALQPLLEARIPPPAPKPAPDPSGAPPVEERLSLHGQKLRAIRAELAGKSELAALNAILIAHLRKRSFPREAPFLFRRIWTEAGPALMQELPGRWLISSIITFGDHGETEAQRRIGLSMNVLLSLMKLYEFERFHSGVWPERAFPARRTGKKKLPLDMPQFSLLGGGLDINLLAQIWHEAREEPVAGALACHLLQRLNEDPRNLFRRIGLMRADAHMDRIEGDEAATPGPPTPDAPPS